jgi:hypothetical protein
MATSAIVTDIVGKVGLHTTNGQLVTIDDYRMLADELIWAFKTKNTATKQQTIDYFRKMLIIL